MRTIIFSSTIMFKKEDFASSQVTNNPIGVLMMKKVLLTTLLFLVLCLTFVSALDDVTVDFSDTTGSGNPGDSVTFSLTLENAGADAETVSFSSTDLTDSSSNTITAPSISDESVEAGATDTVEFSITVPSTDAGDYTGTLTVTEGSTSEDYSYTLTVAEEDAYTVSITEINIDTQAGDTETESFTIENEGSTALSTWEIVFESDDSDDDEGAMEDEDGDEILVTISSPENSLAPGESMTIEIEFEVDQDVDSTGYDGTVYISTGSATATASVAVSLDVSPAICEDGKQGSDFDISIEDPDSGDDYTPGETVQVEIDLDNDGNDDMDIVIEVILYNEDTGDKEESVKYETSIDEDESETYNIDLELPTDLDDDDTYYIYVQVHEDGNEDDSCDYTSVRIDIAREDEDAQIVDYSVSPANGLACTDEYRVSVFVESLGTDEMEDLYVELVDGELDVSESTSNFDLGDYNDDDNDYKASFDLIVPEGLDEGSYYLEALLYDDNGDLLDSQMIEIELDACGETLAASSSSGSDLSFTVADEFEVNGEELTIALVIENDGSSERGISLSIEEVSWAELDGSEYLEVLGAGDSTYAYLYLTLDMDTEDKHDLQITLTDDLGNEVTELVTIDFGVAETEESFFDNMSFSSSKVFWVLADLILIILALVFIRMLFAKR